MTIYTAEDLIWKDDEPTFASNGDYQKPPKGWTDKTWEEYLSFCEKEKMRAVPSGYFDENGKLQTYSWSPEKLTNYEKAKFVLANGPCIVDGSLCDMYSASAMAQVFESLSPKHREMFNSYGFAGAHSVTFKVIQSAKA